MVHTVSIIEASSWRSIFECQQLCILGWFYNNLSTRRIIHFILIKCFYRPSRYIIFRGCSDFPRSMMREGFCIIIQRALLGMATDGNPDNWMLQSTLPKNSRVALKHIKPTKRKTNKIMSFVLQYSVIFRLGINRKAIHVRNSKSNT